MSNRFRRSKAISLAEVLVYLVLIGILMTGVLGVLVSTLRYYKYADKMADLQQSALLAMQAVSADLSEANQSSVKMDTAAVGGSTWIAFLTSKNADGTYEFDNFSGQIKWQAWIIYCLKTQPNNDIYLIKKTVPLSPATIAPNIATPPFSVTEAGVTGNIAGQKVKTVAKMWVYASNVTPVHKFLIVRGAAPTRLRNYTMNLTIDRTTDSTKPSRLEASTDITVKN